MAAAPSNLSESPPVVSVATCVFNEQDSVEPLVDRIASACATLGVGFEIVVVDDGSRDQTLARLVELSRRVPQLRVLHLFRNFGHMAALSSAMDAARGAAVVLMDGDLQDPPELIPEFYAHWRAGADVVYGLREQRHEGRLRRLLTGGYYWLVGKVAETPMPRQVGTFSLIDRRVLDILRAMPERQRFVSGLRAWVGGRQAFVPYDRPDRPHGASRVRLRGLFALARTSIFSFSKAPLRWASLLSLSCGLVLFAVGLTAIVIRLFTELAIPGWATYTTLIGLTGFVQSLALTMLAEYVAVIFDEVKGRPLFLVRDEYIGGQRRAPHGLRAGGAPATIAAPAGNSVQCEPGTSGPS